MSIINMYDGIYGTVANDVTVLDLLEIGEAATPLEKALHIQRRSKPQNLADNIPLVTFYTPGGGREANNDRVYNALFFFDIYTHDDVEKAMQIAARLLELFDGTIPVYSNISTMQCEFEDGHESEVDLQNTYCFTVIFTFSFEMN